jgi:hypothetical protein
MNTLRTIGALSLATMGLLVACEHEDSHNARSPVAGTDLTSSGATNVQAAANADAAIVDELAMARCEHERSCNNVGDGRKYASPRVCMDQMRGDIANELNTYRCPRGIDSSKLDHCTTAIKNAECANPLDTLARNDKCKTGALCMR